MAAAAVCLAMLLMAAGCDRSARYEGGRTAPSSYVSENSDLPGAADESRAAAEDSAASAAGNAADGSSGAQRPGESAASGAPADSGSAGSDPTTSASAVSPAAPGALKAVTLRTDAIPQWSGWLYCPDKPTRSMPLIVYLHDLSGRGSDPALLLDADSLPRYLHNGTVQNIPAYVWIPQLPADQSDWMAIADTLCQAIRTVQKEYRIDAKRISLTGHGIGASAICRLAAAQPELFTRIAPVCGDCTLSSAEAAKLQSVEVRMFVGTRCAQHHFRSMQSAKIAVCNAGGSADFTLFDQTDHDAVPLQTYTDKSAALLNWLAG